MTRRLLVTIGTVLMLAVHLVVAASPASATVLWSWMPNPFSCDANDNSCVSGTGFNPNVSTWGQSTNPKGNCTNYVAHRLANNGATRLNGSGDASTWRARVESQFGASAVNTVPAVGSVAWWAGTSSNPSGHVGYVESINGNSIYTSESIWDVGSRRRVLTAGQANYPDAFLHILDGGSGGSFEPGSAVSVASRSNGEQFVFWKGTDGNLKESWWSGGSWHGPVNIGMGPLGSAPSVVVRPSNGAVHVFWKGTDNHLWQAWYDTTWHGPQYLGMGTLASQPAATAWGSEIDIFWRGTDGHLWEAWYAGGAWHGSTKIGMGPLGSAPTVGSHPNGEQDVFWKGADGNLWQAWYFVGGSWNGPVNRGMGPLGSAPTVAVRAFNGEQDVFWKGQDGNLWQAYWNGGWHGPYCLNAGPLGSAPSATAWDSEVDVYWRGGDGNLWERWYSGSAWYGPGMASYGPIAPA